jgi:hypothetical protein
LVLSSLPIHSLLHKIRCESAAKNEDNNCYKRITATIIVTGTKLFVLGVPPREQKFNIDHFLVIVVPELCKENRCEWQAENWQKPTGFHMGNSMCHNRWKSRKYFARKTRTRVFRPMSHQNLLPCDFWSFGQANEWVNDQIITSGTTWKSSCPRSGQMFVETFLNQCSLSG